MPRLASLLASLIASLALLGAAAPAVAHVPQFARPAQIDVDVDVELDREAVRAKLAARRATTVARFLAYREARVYPVVTHGRGFQHVWRDVHGNLCAAATLISHDWGKARVVAVGRKDNAMKIAKVTRGPIADWMLTSGLTKQELVAIQVPGFAMPEATPRDVEIARLYSIYIDVERQLADNETDSLELATDALMKQPALARAFLAAR